MTIDGILLTFKSFGWHFIRPKAQCKLREERATSLLRSSFVVFDTNSIGPNLDIIHRFKRDEKGKTEKDAAGRPIMDEEEDSVDGKENYDESNLKDMFEDPDPDHHMRDGRSKQGFELLAYIIVNYLCEAVKCPVTIDNMMRQPENIFTWLRVHHLAYTILLLEHSVNRWAREAKRATQEGLPGFTRQEKLALRGGKFPKNGISGREGQVRYNALLMWLQSHLFKFTGKSSNDRQLIQARRAYLSELVNNMVRGKLEAELDTCVGFWKKRGRKQRQKRRQETADPLLAEIHLDIFSQDFTSMLLSDGSLTGTDDSQGTL